MPAVTAENVTCRAMKQIQANEITHKPLVMDEVDT